MASDLSNSVQILFDIELKVINDLVDRLDQYKPVSTDLDTDFDVMCCTVFLLGVRILLIRNLREVGVVRYLVKDGWTGTVLLLITKDTDLKDFESAVKEIQALGASAIDYQTVMEVDYIGRTVSDVIPPTTDAENPKASQPLLRACQSSAMVHQKTKTALRVLIDEKMKAFRDFAHKLKQHGPRHKIVVGLTKSLLGVKMLLISNLCEALAVKHLMQEGWTGSVVLVVLSRGTPDLHDDDFDLSVKEIVESRVPGFKILMEVEHDGILGPEDPTGGVVSSGKSSAMVYQQQPWYDDPSDPVDDDDDAYHCRRVRRKMEDTVWPATLREQLDQIDERVRAIQTREPQPAARVDEMQSQLDQLQRLLHENQRLQLDQLRENQRLQLDQLQRLLQENQRLQLDQLQSLLRENQRLQRENQRLAALQQTDAP